MEEIFRTAGIILAFLLLVFRGRSTWFTSDRLAAFGFGLTFCLVPKHLLEFQVVGELDERHECLARLYGITLLSTSFFNYFTRDTRDGTVPISVMLARVFSCGVSVIAIFYTVWGIVLDTKSIQWSTQVVTFGLLGKSLWMVGHLVHLLRSSDFSTYPQHNIRINSHLHIDSFLGMMQTFLFISFPDYIFQFLGGSGTGSVRPDAVHTHLMRMVGCQFLFTAVVSLHAPGFLHEGDKKKHFIARILETALFVGMLMVQLLLGSPVASSASVEHLLYALLVFVPSTLNAIVGYFSDTTTLYRIKQS